MLIILAVLIGPYFFMPDSRPGFPVLGRKRNLPEGCSIERFAKTGCIDHVSPVLNQNVPILTDHPIPELYIFKYLKYCKLNQIPKKYISIIV